MDVVRDTIGTAIRVPANTQQQLRLITVLLQHPAAGRIITGIQEAVYVSLTQQQLRLQSAE